MNNKRGQIFILAAVIISAIVLSMGLTANYAKVQREPQDFYGYGFEVKRETGAVIDYGIYNTAPDANIEKFVEVLVSDIQDRDDEASFVFIYGNKEKLVIENYGKDVANVASGTQDGQTIAVEPGNLEIKSDILIDGSTFEVNTDYKSAGGTGSRLTLTNGEDFTVNQGEDLVVKVNLAGHEHEFPIGEHNQVIFLIQKVEGDETYISIK